MALEQYGEAYAEQRAKGIDPSTATSAAITYALAEYWTEKIPLKILLNPKLSLGKRILGEILTDIPGELAATTIEQGLVDTVTTNPNATLGDFLTALKDTAIQTAIAAPLLGGASHPLVRWAEKAEARLIHDAVTTRSYIHMSDQELSDYVGKAQGLVKGHPEIQPDVNILMGDLARRQSYSDPIERQADEMLKKLSQELGVALGNPDLQHEMGLMDERDTARQMSAVTDEMAKPLFSKVAGETAPTTGDVAMRTSVYYDEVDRSLSGIRGALSKEETKVYSDRVRKRIDEGLNFPDWPYIPKVYSYAGGETTRAQHIIANKVAHNITVPEGILYNAIADPLRLRAEATRIANKEQYQFENLGLEENIFDHLVTRQGYEGYVERSARSNNEEVMLLFGLRKAEGAQKFGAAMSQQIDTVSTPPTTLAESLVLGRQQAPLLSTHAQEVGASYPEVKLSPSVIRQHYYGGESSGLLEPSIAITGTAPRQSLLSYLSEIGLSRDQNSVMVFLPDDEPNGHHVQFTLQAVDPELIKKQLDKMGVDEVNLTEGQDGSINVDTFIFDGWDQESTQKAAIKNAALIKLYHTYGTGDITQPRNAATFIERKDYHRNIRDFYGSEKGERVYGQRAEEGQQHRASVGRDQLERVRQREALEGGRGRARGKGYPGTQQGVQGYPESLTGPGEVLPREYAAQEEVVPEEKEASPEGETPPTLPNPAILFARDVSIPSYTLSYPPKPAYTPRQIVAMVRDFKKRIPSIGAVVVVKDVGGIPSHMVEKAGGIQEGDRVFGMYDPEHDTTYLIADSITSPLALHVLLLHEIIGHRGIIGVLGDRERSDVVDMVRRAYENTDVGRDVIKRYGLDMGSPGDQMRFGHELIAYMAETGEQASLLQRVIAMIKEALRKLGINLPFTDADVMNLIEKSYQFSRAVTRPVPISQAKPEFFKLTAEVAGLREQFSAAMPGNLASASPLERLLKTPMNIDNPHVKRLFELFQETRQELYNRHLIQLIGEGDDNSLDAKHKLMRQSPEDYLRFRDIWLWVDRHYQKTREEREDFQLLMRNLEQKVRNLGMSEEGIRVWRLDRETNDRALDALTAESRDLLNHLELESTVADDPFEAKDASRNWMSWDVEAADRFDGVKWFTVTDSTADRYHLPGAPGIHYRVGSLKGGGFGVRQVLFEKGTFNDDPEMMRAWWEQNKALFHKNNVDPRADLRQTLRGAIAMMGEMKGTYAPRVRPRGKYAVKAWRTVEGEKVFWRSNHGWSWSAGEQMKRLREDGWEDVRKVDVSTLPEDIYQNVRMADLTKAIQFTMDKARSGEYGTITPEMADMMYRDLNEMFSDMVKERGFLQHRMQRLRDVLVEGYETDPLQASIKGRRFQGRYGDTPRDAVQG
jgi:hypothetical protein